MNIRSWLRRKPQPHSLRVDGRAVAIGTGARKWGDLLDTLDTLGGARCEALDSSGTVLRACDLGSDEAPGAPDVSRETAGVGPLNDLGALVTMSRLLSEHADQAAARHESAYRYGFDTLTSIVSMLAARLTAIEGAWHKTLVASAEAAAAAAEGSGGSSEILALLAPMMSGAKAAAAPNGAVKS